MSYLSTLEMRRYLSEEQALVWHLQHNHYPPISLAFLPAVREALVAARRNDFDRRVPLPTGKNVTVADVIAEAHLEAFLDQETETSAEWTVGEDADD